MRKKYTGFPEIRQVSVLGYTFLIEMWNNRKDGVMVDVLRGHKKIAEFDIPAELREEYRSLNVFFQKLARTVTDYYRLQIRGREFGLSWLPDSELGRSEKLLPIQKFRTVNETAADYAETYKRTRR